MATMKALVKSKNEQGLWLEDVPGGHHGHHESTGKVEK